MFCEKCGTKLNDGAAFCHVCGTPTHAEPSEQKSTYQSSPYGELESTLSTAKTLGILAIVGACTITLGGLICGIVGFLKVKDLQVPPQYEAQKESARKLNLIGIIIAAALTVLGFILVGTAGCTANTYYY